MRLLPTILGLLLAGSAAAEDYADIVDRAFAAIETDYHADWAFTESSTEDDITRVGRYDPRNPEGERWALISIDGREPSDDELAEYLDDKDHDHQFDSDDGDDDFTMVDSESLELVEETDDYWIFSFRPTLDDEDEDEDEAEARAARNFMDHVDGTIKIVRDGNYIEYLDMRNARPIRPAFSVKISRFVTRLTFGPVAIDGPVVPLSIDVQIKGRAALVIRFEETESTQYSDFEYAGS